MSRAKLFISNIHQRRQTLTKITRHIVELQRDFLDRGIRSLAPLTRARVAVDLGMHESTVSRATAAKYCMLPTGEVIPFSNFFVANLGIKDLIKDLIDRETTPLTDRRLRTSSASARSRWRGARWRSIASSWGYCRRRCDRIPNPLVPFPSRQD